MMRSRYKLFAVGLLSSLLVLVGGTAAASEPLQQVLDKVASVYGATPPAAIRETGTTSSFVRGSGAMLRLFRAPDRFRSEISYASGAEVRTMIGNLAWQQNTPASPVLRGAVALQVARMGLPWNMLAQPSATVDMGSTVNAEGKPVRVIELTLEPQLKLLIEIEIETGYIVRSRGMFSAEGKTVDFSTTYSDFRPENGRIHASREEQYAMGRHIGNSVIERVEYPQTIPDSAFTPDAYISAQLSSGFGLTARASR